MKLSEAEELLPWAIAGTLSEDEAKAVQAFIDNGDIKPETIAELEFLADTVQIVAKEEPKYNPAILNKVMSQLDSVEQDRVENVKVTVPKEVVKEAQPGLFAAIAEFFQWSLTPAWAKVTIAAQLTLLLGVLAIFSFRDGAATDKGFITAAGDGKGDFRVMFNPNSTEADIRALLQQYNLTIVDGPSAINLYTLDAVENADKNSLQSLLSENSAINFVQPME